MSPISYITHYWRPDVEAESFYIQDRILCWDINPDAGLSLLVNSHPDKVNCEKCLGLLEEKRQAIELQRHNLLFELTEWEDRMGDLNQSYIVRQLQEARRDIENYIIREAAKES